MSCDALDFFLLDTHEDENADRCGFYLFGKLANRAYAGLTPDTVLVDTNVPEHQDERGKESYVSCCIQVRQVRRRIYVRLVDDEQATVDAALDALRHQCRLYVKSERSCCMQLIRRRVLEKEHEEARDVGAMRPFIEIDYVLQLDKPSMIDINVGQCNAQRQCVLSVHHTQWSPTERMLLDTGAKGPRWLRIRSPTLSRVKTNCALTLECMLDGVDLHPDSERMPDPRLNVATLCMHFQTIEEREAANRHGNDMVPNDLQYQLQTFAMIAYQSVEMLPLGYSPRVYKSARRRTCYHYCIRFDNDTDRDEQEEAIMAMYKQRGELNVVYRSFRAGVEDEQQAFYESVRDCILREDPDVLINHGLLPQNFVRLVYEFKNCASRVLFVSFLSRLRRRNVQCALKSVEYRSVRSNVLSSGRICFDTRLLYHEYLKDKHARCIRSDRLEEFVEAYLGEQASTLPNVDQRSFDYYRPLDCHPSIVCTRQQTAKQCLFDTPLEKDDALPLFDALFSPTQKENEPSNGAQRIDWLLRCEQQVQLVHRLDLIPFTVQLARTCGNMWSMNLENITSNRIEYFMMHELHSKQYIVERFSNNQVGEQGQTYKGGKIYETSKGCYEGYNFLLDVARMYPSIIQQRRVCIADPSQLLKDEPPERDEELDQILIVPSIVRRLRAKRAAAEEQMQRCALGSAEYTLHSIESQVLKIISNQCYGNLGSDYFRFRNKTLAEFITRSGVEILRSLIDTVAQCRDELGFAIVYGHTDSLMVHKQSMRLDECMTDLRRLQEKMNQLHDQIHVKLDGVYRKIILYGDNSYAGLRVRAPTSYDRQMRTLFRNVDNPRVCDLHKIYEVQFVGCKLTNRQRAYFAQTVCMYVLHQLLMWDAYELFSKGKEFRSNAAQRLHTDLQVFLGAVGEQLERVQKQKGDTNHTPLSVTVHNRSALRFLTGTSSVRESYSSYKQATGDHLKAIKAVKRHLERYTYRFVKIEYVFVRRPGTMGALPVLVEELGDKASTIDWNIYLYKELASLVKDTFACFEGTVSIEQLFSWLRIDASIAKSALLTTTNASAGDRQEESRKRMYSALLASNSRMYRYQLGHQLLLRHRTMMDLEQAQLQRQLVHWFGNDTRELGAVDARLAKNDVPFTQFNSVHRLALLGTTNDGDDEEKSEEECAVDTFRIYCPRCKCDTDKAYFPLRSTNHQEADDDEDAARPPAPLQNRLHIPERAFTSCAWADTCPSCRQPYDEQCMYESARRCVEQSIDAKWSESSTNERQRRVATLEYWSWLLDNGEDLQDKGCSPEEQPNLLAAQKRRRLFGRAHEFIDQTIERVLQELGANKQL